MAIRLTRAQLVELEAAQARSVEVIEAVIADRGITAQNRGRAREMLPEAQRHLQRLRQLLQASDVG